PGLLSGQCHDDPWRPFVPGRSAHRRVMSDPDVARRMGTRRGRPRPIGLVPSDLSPAAASAPEQRPSGELCTPLSVATSSTRLLTYYGDGGFVGYKPVGVP